jgi:hypothetical protein
MPYAVMLTKTTPTIGASSVDRLPSRRRRRTTAPPIASSTSA